MLEDTKLPGLLVTPSWLAEHIDDADLRISDLCILDVRQAEHYHSGHIPGAHHAPLDVFTCTRDGIPGMLLPPAEYADLMASLGISAHTAVVVYDDNWSMAAARVFWSLEYYGHRSVAVVNGGWNLWRASGLPTSTLVLAAIGSEFTPQPDGDRIATYAWLTERLVPGQDAGDLLLVDTRTLAEFARGHLPGAIHRDWTNSVSPDSWDAARDADELRQELRAAGITEDKEIVVYCRSGVRAAHTYLVLRHLGYPRVRNYDGSWLEWSARMGNA